MLIPLNSVFKQVVPWLSVVILYRCHLTQRLS